MPPRRFLVILVLGLGTIGCAHRRQVFYPGDQAGAPAPGVRVKAPFVDVHVPDDPGPADSAAIGVEKGAAGARRRLGPPH